MNNTKKRVLTLLLAGLMLSGMSSCSLFGGDDTEEETTTEETTVETTTEEIVTAEPTEYTEATGTVYTTQKGVQLRSQASTKSTALASLDAGTKLERIEKNNIWSKVVYEGQEGYVYNQYITTDDLLGEKFTTIPTTTYYANDAVKVRIFASTASYSTAVRTLSLGESVSVCALGASWVKIQDGTNYYFVAKKYLSTEKIVDKNSDEEYLSMFTTYTATMYATGSVVIRKSCNLESDALAYVQKGDAVEVIAKCDTKIDDVLWYRVNYTQTVGGTALASKTGYISAAMLSTSSGSAATLADILASYPDYKALATPLDKYVVTGSSLNLRTAPSVSSSEVVVALQAKTKVSVVAVGPSWSVILYEGQYCFASSAYLTVNSDGKPAAMDYDEFALSYSETYDTTNETYYLNYAGYGYNTEELAETYASETYLDKYKTEASLTLNAGDSVTVVAKSKSGQWWVVLGSDDLCYFVTKNIFKD